MHRSSPVRTLGALLALAIALAGFVPALSPASAAAAPAPLAWSRAKTAPTPKQVELQWAPGVQQAQIDAAAERIGFKVVRTSRTIGWTLVAPTRTGLTAEALSTLLNRSGLVKRSHAERFYTVSNLPLPNDPLFSGQWALHNTGQTGGTPGADISAVQAWTRTHGSKDVVVAVVDTGMDWQAPDLRPNIWTNTKEIPGNGIDDDHNGYVDDVHGYDFGNRDATMYDPADGDQHATHVAGIIGAASDNATGMAGVNWNVTIMPVKFLVQGSGTDFDGAEAIHYAVDNGADIINCSWGGTEPSDLLNEAFHYAAQHGVLCVCAAGNDGSDVDQYPDYPGCIDATNIINVAATDNNDQLAYFSNYGHAVDIAAPGVDVTSTLPYDCAGVFVDAFPYRVSYLAFPLEEIQPSSAAQRILSNALMQLSPMAADVMVVDDSAPEGAEAAAGQRLAEYVGYLHSAGYTNVTTWSTDAQGTPSAAAMAGKTVVWFTGARMADPFLSPIFTPQDLTQLSAFLDSGGRLLLSSGEAADDLTWSQAGWEWMMQYLHVDSWDFSAWGGDLKGFDGTPFEGISGALADDYKPSGVYGMAGSDSIQPIDQYATPIVGLGGYGPLSGTSMAAPHVTGAAALLMAAMPTATPAEIRDRVVGTTDQKAQLADVTAQGGRLNVWAAMQYYPGRPSITVPKTGAVLRGGHQQQLAWTTSASSSASQTFEAELGLPATAFSAGFEDGTLGPFCTTADANGWTTTDTAHTGSYAIQNGAGMGADISSVWTTVTVPPGGEVSFWYRLDGDPQYFIGALCLDSIDYAVWLTPYDVVGQWAHVTVPLPEGEHRLYWADNQDPSAAQQRFVVDDITVSGFDFQPLGTAPAGATGLTFSVPSTDVPDARIRVRSNLGGRTSAWSDEVDVRLSTDDTPPSTPGGFSAVPGTDGDVALSWTNPSAGEGAVVRVLRRFDTAPAGPDDASATVVYEGTDLGAHDTGMKSGEVAHYAAFAIDPAANVSDGAFASADIVDTTAPGAVRGLQAGMSDGVAGVCWLAPAPGDAASVRLLRRTDATPTGPSDSSAVVVYEGSATFARDYLLTRHPFEGTAYYAAFAVDPSGNVGPRSAVSLQVGGSMKGTFDLNHGAKYSKVATVTAYSAVPGAVRMRTNLGDEWGAWGSYQPTMTLTLTPLIDGLHTVRMEYENAAGEHLELSDNIFLEIAPPAAPTGLKAEPWSNSVKLTWTQSPEADLYSYMVYGATSAAGPYRIVTDVPSDANGYVLPASTGYTYFEITAKDIAFLESARTGAVTSPRGAGVVRVSGPDRYSTAVAVSKKHFSSADTVVLATGENFADALSASGLAGSYDAPILLTRRDSLPAAVAGEIARLGAHKVFLIGGTSAISTAVASSLEASYTVQRVSGPDRYGTAVAVVRALDAHETTPASAAVLVNGASFADGTSVAAIAYANHLPVLLTPASSLPATTSAMLDWLGVQDVYLIGGEPAIGWDVEESLWERFNTMRIGGSNRYETSAMVAETFAGMGMAKFDYAAVASGLSYPDALTGGAAAGKEGGVVVLTSPYVPGDETLSLFDMHSTECDRVEILGGPSAVSEQVRWSLQDILGGGGAIFPPPAEWVPGAGEPPYPDLPLFRRRKS